jgi:thioesterase-3
MSVKNADLVMGESHEMEFTVRRYHLDLGIVNNAQYLLFLDEARWAWFEAAVRGLGGHVMPVIVHTEINYHRPAVKGDRLIVTSRVGEVREHSAVIHQEIRLAADSTQIVDADTTIVLLDAAGKAMAMEGPYKAFLSSLP